MAIHQPTADVDFADQEILAASQAGDKIALEILYRWYAPRLLKFCQNRLRDLAEAEDAAHETILKAYAALPTFRDGAKIWPWLATIASNVCTDIQRRRKYFDSAEFTEPPSQDFQEAVDARARAEIVNAALTELPSRYQTLVYLRDFSGLSYEEIAQKLDTSVATVRSRLLRGRSMLRLLIRRVAKQRGHWPLPIAVPTFSSLRLPPSLGRRAQAVRSEIAGWWLRLENVVDFASLPVLVNTVAIVVLMMGAAIGSSDPVTAHNQQRQVSVAPVDLNDVVTRARSEPIIRTEKKRRSVFETARPSISADLDGDERSKTWLGIGPVEISCDPNGPPGTIRDTVCPELRRVDPPN